MIENNAINQPEINNQQSDLYQIIYISEAVSDINYSDLENILFSASKNNKMMNLTGMLVFRESYFIQIIEGNKQDVKSLLGRIISDRRHTMMRVLGEWSIDKRFFPEWTMSFVDADLVSNFHPFMQKLLNYAMTTDVPNQKEFQKFYEDYIGSGPAIKHI